MTLEIASDGDKALPTTTARIYDRTSANQFFQAVWASWPAVQFDGFQIGDGGKRMVVRQKLHEMRVRVNEQNELASFRNQITPRRE